jgi:helicase
MADLENLGLPQAVVDLLKEDGITSLYPPQEEALPIALRGKNLFLAVPTASGKSLVAYLALVKAALEGGKGLYIVPLRALASEKFEDLRRFEALGIKVGISIGDYDSPDINLQKYDILISTSEKADSLLRHKTDWLKVLKIIVADEVHLIDDAGRGPTLEVILSRFQQLNPGAQIIALSATVANAKDMAEWLKAELVTSDWRPVKLRPGVFCNGEIHYGDGKVEDSALTVEGLVAEAVKSGGQCLVFVSSRKSCEAQTGNLCNTVEKLIPKDDLKDLQKESERFLKGAEPTSFGRRLQSFVAHGVAFHHAGLRHDQRKLIEELFKARKIKALVATPTLAAGINLPARRVIVRDSKRWDGALGENVYLSVMEIKQMLGRAGRPRYDKEGEGILLARNEWELEKFMENYIHGPPEDIVSKLGTPSALRGHILSSIATGYCGSMDELMEFLSKTFYAHQQDTWKIKESVEEIVDFLLKNDFLISGSKGGLRTTLYGKRVSDLYIDPLSAIALRKALEVAKRRKEKPTAFSYLSAICATPDMSRISGYIRKMEGPILKKMLKDVKKELLVTVKDVEACEEKSDDWHVADDEDDEESEDDLLGQVKLASLLLDWIHEKSEDMMTDFYGVGPGDIHQRVEMAEWMLYSMAELAKVFDTGLEDDIRPLTTRMRYGIKEELLDLCTLRGVARVRARSLFMKGFRTRDDIKAKGSEKALKEVPHIGPELAKSIMDQVRLGEARSERTTTLDLEGEGE